MPKVKHWNFRWADLVLYGVFWLQFIFYMGIWIDPVAWFAMLGALAQKGFFIWFIILLMIGYWFHR